MFITKNGNTFETSFAPPARQIIYGFAYALNNNRYDISYGLKSAPMQGIAAKYGKRHYYDNYDNDILDTSIEVRYFLPLKKSAYGKPVSDLTVKDILWSKTVEIKSRDYTDNPNLAPQLYSYLMLQLLTKKNHNLLNK